MSRAREETRTRHEGRYIRDIQVATTIVPTTSAPKLHINDTFLEGILSATYPTIGPEITDVKAWTVRT